MKTKLQIINETIYYYSILGRRGVQNGHTNCVYFDDKTGNKCAFGRYCADGKAKLLQQMGFQSIHSIFVDVDNFLLPQYHGHSKEFWQAIQILHDKESHWKEEGGITEKGLIYADNIKVIFCPELAKSFPPYQTFQANHSPLIIENEIEIDLVKAKSATGVLIFESTALISQ